MQKQARREVTEGHHEHDPYIQVLADLERKRAEIEAAIKAIQKLRDHNNPLAAAQTRNPPALSNLPTSEAVLTVLEHAGREVSNAQIKQRLLDAGCDLGTSANVLISQHLARLCKLGQVHKVRRGRWALRSDR